MARPLRIDQPGGWYHLTSRGNERKRIFRDAEDREHFLELIGELGLDKVLRARKRAGAEVESD